ncbi:hypothetical protein HMPREF0545_1648 [Ligilactobacillus salivarius DSM 20555 = ATCC 11741]|uniref:Uncharacterized protein n=1 Tax=Ligilactobacillus salivarius DSM 20555 = ATCC 11741 TaxID=1423799 RepID=C2EJ26_9LACO|nr:hypothetical protein HMPREF0545_1648 [Ligilactobacillus salivarius DSM 20555 = ATCC 11741]
MSAYFCFKYVMVKTNQKSKILLSLNSRKLTSARKFYFRSD